MMHSLLDWLDHRTGYRKVLHEALYERIPGGSRWRYVWGSTLVFTFAVQVITGIFLWMAYSPSAQTAWESVYYIEFEMTGGWLLRGIHHYTAQAMVVLLALHLMQVMIDGAYRAPREINFWLGLILMLIVLGLALTGYLLPWDQKGYWATQVATKIAGITPLIGTQLQALIVGGKEYGHHTLTRFFALHAGVLPGLLVFFLVLHVGLFRRHGITAKLPSKKPDADFWPDQVLKDGVACLVVLVTVVLLAIYLRAELGAPADPADSYDAARPEWYFLFLFQFLKLFHGETGELIGAIVVPGAVMLLLFLMPFIGRSRAGHWLNVVLIFGVLAGAGLLTALALHEDYHSIRVDGTQFADVEEVLTKIDVDLRKNRAASPYHGKPESEQLAIYFQSDTGKIAEFERRLAAYRAYRKSVDHVEAVAAAKRNAERAQELAADGIPPTGALTLVHNDAAIQGPRLFTKHCASCHDHVAPDGTGIVTPRPLEYPLDAQGKPDTTKPPVPSAAPNLYGFASRDWLRGLLDHAKIAAAKHDSEKWRTTDAPYFGNTKHRGGETTETDDEAKTGDMVGFVRDNLTMLNEQQKKELEAAIVALSAEAKLPSQREADAQAEKDGTLAVGRKALVETQWNDTTSCKDCHKVLGTGDLGMAPDLTGYGSRQWLLDFIGDPAHARFYAGKKNDRMPSFAKDPAKSDNNLLTRKELEQLVDWLRGDQ